MECLTFLDRGDKLKPQPVYVLHGDEPFLKRQAQLRLRKLLLGPDEDGLGVCSFDGDKAAWPAVVEELQTLPFLVPRRLVVVEGADPFVSRERARLEKYFAEVAARPQVKGTLVLDVNTWQATTKLAKATPDAWTITCKAPASHNLPQWCVAWCQDEHGKHMTAQAARLLVDLVGPEMGLLDMEMQKLAAYVGEGKSIGNHDVDALVGRSRLENTWRIFDLIGGGRSGEALGFLERLFDQGEEPMKLLGAFSLQLRRLAQTARLSAQGVSLHEALTRAGVPNFPAARQGAEQQMRHLGRRRLDQLYDWLLAADSGLKGGSQLPPRVVLERLVVRLARAKG
jgi:DNA polymerase-3 subunit delta